MEALMATTVQKWGNSLGIRIPKSIAEQARLRSGTEVEFETDGSVLTVRPRRRRKLKLANLVAKMKGPSPHRALHDDKPVGRELV
jgi:antitoxin MazE